MHMVFSAVFLGKIDIGVLSPNEASADISSLN